MRAPLVSAACAALLLLRSACLVYCHQEEKGYLAEESFHNSIDVLDSEDGCPTDRLVRTRSTCHEDGADIQCIKLHCCPAHIYIAGRCIPESVDPCSLALCEQACEVKGDKVWCTCHPGYKFQEDNYRKKTQPYCIDEDECVIQNGGCEGKCINDPGGYHCECNKPLVLGGDGKRCTPVLTAIPEPLPLIRASSRCYASCDTVTWLSRKVKQLSDQLHTTQATLKKLLDNPVERGGENDRFAEGTFAYRVLDSTAPLEGGFCRCERGPRGPPGAPGMEGPKGDQGARGPRGSRGPKGSMDLMLLLFADIRHDIQNLEARVYKDGIYPERFNLQKAWRRQRKQEMLEKESSTEQVLEAYTAPVTETEDLVDITPNGETGDISGSTETTTDWALIKGEEPTTLPMDFTEDIREKIREIRLLANRTRSEEDEEDPEIDNDDYDYTM